MKNTVRYLRAIFAVFIIWGGTPLYGQTVLSAGDIAFVGFNIDGDDDYAFLLLKDITAGTQLYITDKGWSDATASFTDYTGEATITWTATNDLIAGSVIRIQTSTAGTTLDPDVASVGSVTGGTVFGTFGDQIFIFQGTELSPTFITGIHSNYTTGTNASNWDDGQVDPSVNANSDLPDQLVNGVNAIWVYIGTSEVDNHKYTGSTISGTPAELRAAINNVANWSSDNSIAFDLSTFDGLFSVAAACTEPDIPTVSVTPTSVCPGATATLTISGSLNDATAWHIYTGSCGGSALGTTATSTFAVNPAEMTNYYVRGEGGCTTPGSCGTASITTKSGPAFTTQPDPETIACEGDGTIVLWVAGTGITSYQWYDSNGAITDSIRNSLTIETLPANSDTYYCIVSSECESKQSNNAVVTINPKFQTIQTVYVCKGDSYTLPDNSTLTDIQNPDDYETILTSQLTGCDSTILTSVRVKPTYDITETVSVCSGSSYSFPDGHVEDNITAQVVHTSEFTSIEHECDSIITTTVTVNPVYDLAETVAVCSGSNYTYPDGTESLNISIGESHTSHLKTVNGDCDSIITTTVTVNPIYDLAETVAICSGSNYTYPDETEHLNITSGESHTSHLKTVNGDCDSIITTTLTIKPTYTQTETATICAGLTYTFPDGTEQVITETTEYQSVLLTKNGDCDSIITTTITVNPSYTIPETVFVCSGGSYTFPDGTVQDNITEDFTYTSEFETKNFACDSNIVTTVKVNPVYNLTETVFVCSGSSYIYPDGTSVDNITEPTSYTSSLKTKLTDCDSIITTELNIAPVYDLTETVSICPGGNYTFPDGTIKENITEGMSYTSELTTETYSCDSTITTTIVLYPTYSIDASKTVEFEGSYQFGSQLLTESGLYTEEFVSKDGCDSTVNLTFTVKPKTVTTTVYDTICNGPHARFRKPKTTEVSETIHKTDLDSIVTTITTIYPWYEFETDETIFIGTSIDFQGESYSEAGTYSKVYETVNGCDSVYTLNLTTERKRVVTQLYDTTCGQLTAEQMPMLVTSTEDSIRTEEEVDSIIITTTVVYPTYQTSVEKTITYGDTLALGTQKLFTAGSYTEPFTSVHGCDSIVTVSLSVINKIEYQRQIDTTCRLSESGDSITRITEKTDTLRADGEGIDIILKTITIAYSSYDIEFADTITYGETYTLGSQLLTMSGEYTEPFTSEHGCDSVVTVALTVLPKVVEHTEYDTICSPELVNSPTRISHLIDTIHVSEYIDSVAHLFVTEHSSFVTDIAAAVNYGQSYEFDGEKLTKAGTYHQYLTTVMGCDSTVNLTLSITPVDVMTVLYDTTCGSTHSAPATIEYATEYDTLATSIGTDSIIKTITTLYPVYAITRKKTIPFGDTLMFGDQKLIKSGTYTDLLKTVFGCDSAVVMTLTVLPDEIPNGGDSVSVTIDENPRKGAVIVTLPVTNSAGDTLSYSLSDTVNFVIKNNELIVLNPEAFDTETNPQLRVELTVDNGETSAVSVITVNNSNVDEMPILDFSAISVMENSATGTFIGELPAVDHEGDSVTYTLMLSRAVTMEGRKLYIADSTLFDAEKKDVVINVIADDGTFRKIIPVSITIGNENDNEPTIAKSSFSFMATEHSPVGKVIGTISAEDADNDTLIYSIAANANGAIAIDALTGQITVADSSLFDYETLGTIRTFVTASDGINSVEKELVIILTDMQEPITAVLSGKAISVTVYPTLVSGSITIEIPTVDASISIISDKGTVYAQSDIYGTSTVDLSELPAGAYTVLVAIDGTTVTNRIIKE